MSKKVDRKCLKITGRMKRLTLTPYHKRRCRCPFCGMIVIAHKLRRHQTRASCQLVQLSLKVA